MVGRNTVLSRHSIRDIDKIKANIDNTKILVRCNPIGDWSGDEFDRLNVRGSKIDAVMLPYFKTVAEVETFIALLDASKIEPVLLIETLDAVKNLEEILSVFPFKYVHVGLNDLHIERDTVSMFEPFIDGLINHMVSIFKKNNQNFGIGGIGKIGSDLSPSPEFVLNEHLRLESKVIYQGPSRDFMRKKKHLFEKELFESVADPRNYEKIAREFSRKQLEDSYRLMTIEIEETVKNDVV